MRNLKRNAAAVGASAIMAALGLGGVMSAHANTTSPPSHAQVQKAAGSEKAGETPETSDGADVGPDANPNEPGHQDANQPGQDANQQGGAANEKGGTSGESESATDDGPNVGPDANPSEPGHQDAGQTGDTSGN
ncbi:MAG: hypothetical protein ACR2JU_01715 [Nocardioidaceae bacterium]